MKNLDYLRWYVVLYVWNVEYTFFIGIYVWNILPGRAHKSGLIFGTHDLL